MKIVREINILDTKSSNHKGFYVNEKSRALEINDVELCKSVMFDINTGSNHPWSCEVPKDKVISYLNGAGKPKVYNWHFLDNDFNKRLDMPHGIFHIVIGHEMVEHV